MPGSAAQRFIEICQRASVHLHRCSFYIVKKPKHYNQGKYEAIDVIEDWKLNFNLGNTVKYISRAGHKDNIIQDLKKSLWYLNREIERLEKGE